MRLNPESIARASSRHPWRTVVVWLVIFVLAGASSSMLLGSALTTDIDFTNTPEAKEAQQILEERRLEQDLVTENWVIAGTGEGAVEDPAFVEQVNAVLEDLNALGSDIVTYAPPAFPLPAEVAENPETAPLGPIPSEDGRAVLFTVVMAGDIDDAAEHVEQLETIRQEASAGDLQAYILGNATSTEDFRKVSEEDLRFGESIGVVAAMIVLIAVFGALIAGVTPIIMAIFAISVTLGIVAVIGQLWKFTFFAPNLISMMGLAVGIDYSLFIVSRYREERRKGGDKLRAIGRSGATANRAVFFSGLTVVIALSGMLLVPTTIFRGLAGGAIIVVLVSVAASMTLLPAVLSLLGKPAERVGSDWLDWPWMSRIANGLALLGMIVVAGAVATIASAVGAPGGLAGLAGFLGFVGAAIVLTKWLRRESSWLSRRIRHGQIEQGRPGGFWDRASRAVMARPVISLVLSASFLILLSLPFWLQPHPDGEGRGIKQGLAGVTTLPDDVQTKQAFLALVEYFPKSGANSTGAGRDPGQRGRPGGAAGDRDADRRDRRRSATGQSGAAAGERGRERHASSTSRSPARRPMHRARRRSWRSESSGGRTSPRRSALRASRCSSVATPRSSPTSSTSRATTRRSSSWWCSGCRSSCSRSCSARSWCRPRRS